MIKAYLLLLGIFSLTFSATNFRTTHIGRQTKSVEKSGIVDVVGKLSQSRAVHRATLLDNGKVLITGGFSADRKSLASTEAFDPKSGEFFWCAKMNAERAGHSATLLPGGKVLIAGGLNESGYLDSAEIYDPQTGDFTPVGKMTLPRSEHIAVLLNNGKVLIAGGVGKDWTFLADAEIFDPATKNFTKTGNMMAARESHTATLLKDGTVLITGGHKGRRAAMEIYKSAEIYNPQTGKFTVAADLTVKRHKHDAVLLNDGRVLIVGGANERDAFGAYKEVEIYNPKTRTFAKIGEMKLARYKLQGTSILLKNGKVFIAGGANQAEIFDPKDNSFEIIDGNFDSARLFATATLLSDGQILIVGGYNPRIEISPKAWIYKS